MSLQGLGNHGPKAPRIVGIAGDDGGLFRLFQELPKRRPIGQFAGFDHNEAGIGRAGREVVPDRRRDLVAGAPDADQPPAAPEGDGPRLVGKAGRIGFEPGRIEFNGTKRIGGIADDRCGQDLCPLADQTPVGAVQQNNGTLGIGRADERFDAGPRDLHGVAGISGFALRSRK